VRWIAQGRVDIEERADIAPELGERALGTAAEDMGDE
jgi:hypothetical protein